MLLRRKFDARLGHEVVGHHVEEPVQLARHRRLEHDVDVALRNAQPLLQGGGPLRAQGGGHHHEARPLVAVAGQERDGLQASGAHTSAHVAQQMRLHVIFCASNFE